MTEGGRYGKQTLSNIWDFTFFDEDKKYLALTDEAFYLYHVAHMIKHFENGGCGIRPFVDLWLLNNKMEFNKQKRYELLKQEGLDKFSLASEKLSRVWLENEQTDSLTESMQAYVLTGGAFGTDENRVNIQQTKKGGKFKYILSRIFISKKELRLKYPILEKQPILTPFYHVRRWLKLIFIKKSRKQSFTEFSHTMEVDKMDVLQSKQMLKDLGIETD